jgi:hypothetical protein
MPSCPVGSEQVRSPVLPGTRSPNRIRDTPNVPLRHNGSCAYTGELMLTRTSWLTPKSPPLATMSKDLEPARSLPPSRKRSSLTGRQGPAERGRSRLNAATSIASEQAPPVGAKQQSASCLLGLLRAVPEQAPWPPLHDGRRRRCRHPRRCRSGRIRAVGGLFRLVAGSPGNAAEPRGPTTSSAWERLPVSDGVAVTAPSHGLDSFRCRCVVCETRPAAASRESGRDRRRHRL